MRTILIAADQAGLELKSILLVHLQDQGLSVQDRGSDIQRLIDDMTDDTDGILVYNQDMAISLERHIADCGHDPFNRPKGVRFTVAVSTSGMGYTVAASDEMVRLARIYQDKNLLIVSASLSPEKALSITDTFLQTPAGRPKA